MPSTAPENVRDLALACFTQFVAVHASLLAAGYQPVANNPRAIIEKIVEDRIRIDTNPPA